jgi:katanin p60 ATPase-containing subunit A1
MDGIAKTDDRVFFLAASNLPWALDSAMLRRLEKRVLVDLPDTTAREFMFRKWMPASGTVGELEYEQLAAMTEGYSGSDVHLLYVQLTQMPRSLYEAAEETVYYARRRWNRR